MDKNVRRFLTAAEEQGFQLKALKSGVMYLAPDGMGKVTIHRTPSDAGPSTTWSVSSGGRE